MQPGRSHAPGAEENWTLSVQHSVDDVQHYVDTSPRWRATSAPESLHPMRAIVEGLVLMVALSVIVLSIKPGGLSSVSSGCGAPARLVLLLGGVYLVLSTAIRVFFQPMGVDYGRSPSPWCSPARFSFWPRTPRCRRKRSRERPRARFAVRSTTCRRRARASPGSCRAHR